MLKHNQKSILRTAHTQVHVWLQIASITELAITSSNKLRFQYILQILMTVFTNPTTPERQLSSLCEKRCSNRCEGHSTESILQNNPLHAEYKNFVDILEIRCVAPCPFYIKSVKTSIRFRLWKAHPKSNFKKIKNHDEHKTV